MRNLHIGVFIVIAVAGLATLLLSVSYFPEPSPFAVQYVPGGYTAPESTIIINLEVGEFITNEIEAISSGLIPNLRSGTIYGKDIRTDYFQTIRFGEPGIFTGCRATFGRDELNRVSDFLECTDSVFLYEMTMSPGLRSEVVNGDLVDIINENVEIMGHTFTIVDAEVSGNSITLQLFGGFGSLEWTDRDFTDNDFTDWGASVNRQNIEASVKIRAVRSGNKVTIASIQHLLKANPVLGGTLQVLPLHCVREYLQYPLGMLVPTFDICNKGFEGAAVPSGVAGISGNEVWLKPSGDDEYRIYAQNLYGRQYDIPLAQLPGSYGIKGRDFVFVEAANAGAPNIDLGDYIALSSRNTRQGVSHIVRFDNVDPAGTIRFEDLGGGSKQATFNPATGEGQLLMGEGTYKFRLTGNMLAMDQTNDNSISGDEANFVLPGGSRLDFGPGFVVKLITPRENFDDATADEVTRFNIVFGDDIDVVVPSPQNTIPGYTFELQSAGGGVKQGLTKYGALFTWDKDSGRADDLKIIVPGAYARSVMGGATGEVYITFERSKLMRTPEQPRAPARCGDGIITPPEYCDPPGSFCSGTQPFERGECAADCMKCDVRAPAQCGNNLLENGEECESAGDCAVGFDCQGCKCAPLPAAVCGNNLIENGEDCENDFDCAPGWSCDSCKCVSAPKIIEVPAPPPPPPTFADVLRGFWSWLTSLFGG